jgi:hypothetical protein
MRDWCTIMTTYEPQIREESRKGRWSDREKRHGNVMNQKRKLGMEKFIVITWQEQEGQRTNGTIDTMMWEQWEILRDVCAMLRDCCEIVARLLRECCASVARVLQYEQLRYCIAIACVSRDNRARTISEWDNNERTIVTKLAGCLQEFRGKVGVSRMTIGWCMMSKWWIPRMYSWYAYHQSWDSDVGEGSLACS